MSLALAGCFLKQCRAVWLGYGVVRLGFGFLLIRIMLLPMLDVTMSMSNLVHLVQDTVTRPDVPIMCCAVLSQQRLISLLEGQRDAEARRADLLAEERDALALLHQEVGG